MKIETKNKNTYKKVLVDKGFVIGLGILGTISLLLYSVNIRVCPIYNIFGIPCASCGLTRSAVMILRGNLVDSMKYNILGVILSIIATIYLILIIIFGKQKIDKKINEKKVVLIILTTILMITTWVININNRLLY